MSSDPRDQRFYALRKKDLSQHSVIEIRELMKYCDKMLESNIDKKARRMWLEYRAELNERLNRLS
jgi:hypothetical protein